MEAKAHYLLARALFENGEPMEARAEIAAALKLKPDQPEFADLRQRIESDAENASPNER